MSELIGHKKKSYRLHLTPNYLPQQSCLANANLGWLNDVEHFGIVALKQHLRHIAQYGVPFAMKHSNDVGLFYI